MITTKPAWGMNEPDVFDALPFGTEEEARTYGAKLGTVVDAFPIWTGDVITGHGVTYHVTR